MNPSGLVPVHIGHPAPDATNVGAPGRQPQQSAIADPSIDWGTHDLDPRWLGMKSSDCAAAIQPSIYHGHGADELTRFLEGAASRTETAF